MNKEQYLEVMDRLMYIGHEHCSKTKDCGLCKYRYDDFRCIYSEDLVVMRHLIFEHFDNPPLKFEELKDGMWVWDNLFKSYLQIDGCDIENGLVFVEYYDFSCCEEIDCTFFKENRFFRREVENNDYSTI